MKHMAEYNQGTMNCVDKCIRKLQSEQQKYMTDYCYRIDNQPELSDRRVKEAVDDQYHEIEDPFSQQKCTHLDDV